MPGPNIKDGNSVLPLTSLPCTTTASLPCTIRSLAAPIDTIDSFYGSFSRPILTNHSPVNLLLHWAVAAYLAYFSQLTSD